VLSPTAYYAYAGAFVLAEAKGCALQEFPASCVNDLALDPEFNIEQLHDLTHIEPRSVGYCSAKTMDIIWTDIEAEPKIPHLISCIESLAEEEVAIEFSLPQTGDKKLLLRKVYAQTWIR